MTEEEFDAMLEESREQYRQGKYKTIDDIDKFLEVNKIIIFNKKYEYEK